VETFGRYTLLKLAGSGGMAQVHLARQLGPGGFVKPCVLKRIAPEHKGDDRVRRMFLEEARVSALLNHRTVVHTFDFGEVDGVPFMAMELVDGVNLAQLLRLMAKNGRWIAVAPAAQLVREVLMALDYAHNLAGLDGAPLRLVHRDVSPQNILLSRTGDVKLADFGIARHDARAEHTQFHAPKGKPGYMAPEQAMGGEIDGRADLFSLGVVLVELISARRVLPPGQTKIVSLTSLEPRVRDLVNLRTDASPTIKDYALRLCALDVDERPSDAKAALAELDAIIPTLPPSRSLPDLLARIFSKYFPVGLAATPEAPSSSSFPNVEPEDGARDTPSGRQDAPTDRARPASGAGPAELPPAMSAKGDLQFDEGSWAARGEDPEGAATAVVYQGWPTEFGGQDQPPELVLPKSEDRAPAPPVRDPARPAERKGLQLQPIAMVTPFELVTRSSGVEAMEYFKPDFSDEARRRGIEDVDRKEAPAPPLPPPEPEPERQKLPMVPIVLGGAVVVLLGLGIVALVNPGGGGTAEVETGSLRVTSDPAGAAVSIDGRSIGEVTPTVVKNLPIDTPMKVTVSLPKHRTFPANAVVEIQAGSGQSSASFTLKRGRVYRLVTKPEGANVDIGGTAANDVTPLDLPTIPFGMSATITLKLPDHLPKRLVMLGNTTTPTVTEVVLEAGKEIDIVSEPAGAKVVIDKVPVGVTPAYDLLIPLDRKFRVVLSKEGFKPYDKVLKGKAITERTLEVTLEPKPLLALQMSNADRKKAKALDMKLAKLDAAVRGRKKMLADAEQRLEMIQASKTVFIGEIADAQRAVDLHRDALEELESKRADVQNDIEQFRTDLAASRQQDDDD
jgi:serine/threonine protein kinase